MINVVIISGLLSRKFDRSSFAMMSIIILHLSFNDFRLDPIATFRDKIIDSIVYVVLVSQQSTISISTIAGSLALPSYRFMSLFMSLKTGCSTYIWKTSFLLRGKFLSVFILKYIIK